MIGQNIRAWRKRRGLTQNQLGRMCGISGAAIGSYEKGATLPKRRVAEKIAAALDIPVDKLEGALPAGSPSTPSGGALLYDGVLSALRELYGAVEGRVVVGRNGAGRRYYVVNGAPDSFVLYEGDIAAIAQSARASMSPLVERIRKDGA